MIDINAIRAEIEKLADATQAEKHTDYGWGRYRAYENCMFIIDEALAKHGVPGGEWKLDGHQVAVWVYKHATCWVCVSLQDNGDFEYTVRPKGQYEQVTGIYSTRTAATKRGEEVKRLGIQKGSTDAGSLLP
jgi:hypothetical protein